MHVTGTPPRALVGCMHGSSTACHVNKTSQEGTYETGGHLCKMKICSPFSRHTGSQSGHSNHFASLCASHRLRSPAHPGSVGPPSKCSCHLVNTSAGGGSCRAPVTIRYADTVEQLTADRPATDVFPPSSSTQLTYRSPAHSAPYDMPCMPKPRIRLSC